MPFESRAERRSPPGAQEFLRARELISQERCDAAIPLLRRANEIGDIRNALWNLGICYGLMRRPRQAIEAYQQFLDHPRSNAQDRREAQAAIQRLETSMATLNIRGNVDGADVRVDGHEEGQVPHTIEVGPGEHVIEISSPGFSTWREEFEAAGGESYSFEADLELLPGRLSVRTEPTAATVWVDGERRGDAPWTGALPGGGHLVEVRAVGFRNGQRQVTLPPGQSSSLLIELEPVQGTLAVATNAPGAVLLVDGEARGESPFPPISMEPGRYELEVQAEDHGDWSGEVDVLDTRTTRVELELPSTRGLSQAWFWAIGALAIGSFTSALVLYGLSTGQLEDYEQHAEFVEDNHENPLQIAYHREQGLLELEDAEQRIRLALVFGLIAIAGAVADFFIGLFTRWRQHQAESEITLEEADDEVHGLSVAPDVELAEGEASP